MPYKRYGRKPRPSRARSTRRSVPSRTKSSAPRRWRRGSAKMARKWALWKNPLPAKSMYKFTYQDSAFVMATSSGNGYRYLRVFRGNSLYDPDYTGVGVQPYGYDQLCSGTGSLFNRYIVYGSKITIYPHVYTTATDTAQNYSIRLCLYPSRLTAVSYTGFADVANIPGAICRNIESSNDVNRGNVLTKYMSTRRMFPDNKNLDNTFSSAYDNNPTGSWYWHIVMDNNEFANACTMYIDVKIKYYAVLVRENDVNES